MTDKMSDKEVAARIKELKEKKNAILLVHNYQIKPIRDIGDKVGDSFELAQYAKGVKEEIIVFCGVDFMAESAYILNPGKTVLLPSEDARCPMAAMADVNNPEHYKRFMQLKREHPDAAVVSYINTSAETKAHSDIICTSSNAAKIVNSLPQKEIIFLPDNNLASYVQKQCPTKVIIPWDGYCYVHNNILLEKLESIKGGREGVHIVAHPECRPEVAEAADHVCSTSAMRRYVENSDAKGFIIATEIEMYRLLSEMFPDKQFYSPLNTCIQMKKNTLESVLASLERMEHRITVPEDTRVKAYQALDRMLQVGK